MAAYSVEKPSRVCAGTGRELKVGEPIHSALIEEKGRFRRRDFAADAWTGPPPEAVAHWTGRLPAADAKGKPPIDDELLFECFDRLAERERPADRNLRYVLALFLMRRKRLIFVGARNAGADETMILKDKRDGRTHAVSDPQMGDADLQEAQDELMRILEGD